MTNSAELQEILKALQVSCDNVEYGFTTIPKSLNISTNEILGCIQEDEGMLVLATKEYLQGRGLIFEGPFAKLTIQTQVPIGFIELTAVLAQKLADKGLPANIIAAYYHNLVFVQYDLREQAIAALEELKG
jgi:uncharacterized protein